MVSDLSVLQPIAQSYQLWNLGEILKALYFNFSITGYLLKYMFLALLHVDASGSFVLFSSLTDDLCTDSWFVYL